MLISPPPTTLYAVTLYLSELLDSKLGHENGVLLNGTGDIL